MIKKEEMTAVAIGNNIVNNKSPLEEEYDNFCKTDFSLKISGKELAMLIIASGSIGGYGGKMLRGEDEFHYSNKGLLSHNLYEKLSKSIKGEILCSKINF